MIEEFEGFESQSAGNSENGGNKIKNYKRICFKIGLVMSVFFLSGMVCSFLMRVIEIESETTSYILVLLFSTVFLYLIPIIAALIILKGEFQGEDGTSPLSPKTLYKKPARLIKALGNFPAVYGLGQITNLISLAVAWFITRIPQNADAAEHSETLERSFGTMNSLIPPNILCGVIMFLHMVFAAAFFEELFCRGILLNVLKPYGNGFAIIITGFIFGMMHGNFQQFFYAFVLGIVFAYITIQTGSILAPTLLHAMFNSLAAVIMLFISTETIQNYLLNQTRPGEDGTLLLAVFGIYLALFVMLLVAGIALAIKKLTRLKFYKAENNFTEISARKKSVLFFTSVPVIIMLLLAADRFAGGYIASIVADMVLFVGLGL